MNANRNRDNCKKCVFYNYLNCVYVKLNGTCSIDGSPVAIDYTYDNNLTPYKNSEKYIYLNDTNN